MTISSDEFIDIMERMGENYKEMARAQMEAHRLKTEWDVVDNQNKMLRKRVCELEAQLNTEQLNKLFQGVSL